MFYFYPSCRSHLLSWTEWSLAWFKISLVPCTATGLLAAKEDANSTAFPTASALLPSTRLTKPAPSASSAEKFRAVRHTSFTHDVEPTILGRRARVPMSAARPISTSLTAKLVSWEANRTSVQQAMSMARPMDIP